MPHMKTFPRPTESNDEENKPGHRGGLLLIEIEGGLEILLCDRGRAIDLNTLRGRPLEQIRPGGLGLHLIRQAMDTVEFTRKGLTNQLRLVKYLAQASDAP